MKSRLLTVIVCEESGECAAARHNAKVIESNVAGICMARYARDLKHVLMKTFQEMMDASGFFWYMQCAHSPGTVSCNSSGTAVCVAFEGLNAAK